MSKKIIYILILTLCFGCTSKNDNNATKDTSKANDLIHETSPYLLQHAYNPVNWKAWNPKTLQQAKDENKLIVISVGYSACHWCHVMEEESFENDSIAKLMNANFINIKVDREERPDVDQIYMNAVQLMTGSGGWPLNCIALPDGRPVFGGTYFTKEQWTKVLNEMASLYKEDPKKVESYAERLTQGINEFNLITLNEDAKDFTKNGLKITIENLKETLDEKHGGQKGEPKFPMPSNLNFMLRYGFQNNDDQLKTHVFKSLEKMAYGGIYDQVGGGFSRYSVDEIWHIPHFEKMLYDNAQLVSLYAKAYQLNKNKNFKTIIIETLNFVDEELTNTNGAFLSSLDADSKNKEDELEEGTYYAWTIEELKIIIGDDFSLFKAYYNIRPEMQWENKYVLYKTISDTEFTEANNISLNDLKYKLTNWKRQLKTVRQNRALPRKDDKILTSWNALMLEAYVDAYSALGEKVYLEKALKNAAFISKNQIKDNGALYHSYKNGKSSIEGFAEDYALTVSAFIKLYQATFDDVWLEKARKLMEYCKTHFLNADNKMFYFTTDKVTNLLERKVEVIDNVIPSSNSIMAQNLYELGHYYLDNSYTDLAKQMLSNISEDIEKAPTGYTNWLDLYLNYAYPHYEVAICGSNSTEVLKTINKRYLPNIMLAGSKTETSNLPLLQNKYIDDETFIYVCTNGVCKLPVTDANKAIDLILK